MKFWYFLHINFPWGLSPPKNTSQQSAHRQKELNKVYKFINQSIAQFVLQEINKTTNMRVKNYKLLEQIGSGSFSTVFKAVSVTDQSKVYAIKSMRDIPQNEQKAVRKQISILEEIQKKNIKNVVNYITEFTEKNKWYIVFEYCSKGDLDNFLKKQGRLPETFCKNLASSVIEPLSQLHEKGIAHRDLKLSNILINDEYDFKIADFGMAKAQEGGIMESYCGTPYAMAPQVLRRQSYDTKCDTWSLGIMIYQLVYGKLPFDGRKNGGGMFGLTAAVLQDEPYYNPSVKVSEECINFIKQCLKKNPNQRPTMKQLAQHPWLSIGVGSLIRKDLLKQSFQGNSLQVQTTKRAKQVLNQAVAAHITKMIKHYKFNGKQIANMMNVFDKYYKDEKKVKQNIILLIAKIIKELVSKPVLIDIDKHVISIKLTKVESFRSHIMNLESILKQILEKLGDDNKGDASKNLQREVITFVVSQAESCIALDENYPDKIALIQYLSKLPLYIPNSSTINIKWGFNEVSAKTEMMFNEYVKKLTEEVVYKFVNEPCNGEGGQKNWIIQHNFERVRREGSQIELGEFISKIIDINSPVNESVQQA